MMKRARSLQRGQTLIIIFLGVLLLGGASHALNMGLPGGSVKELRSRIKDVVKDPERRTALMSELDEWEKERKSHEERYEAVAKDVLQTFAKTDGTPADFDQAFSKADALNADIEQSFLNAHDALHGKLDAAEWRQIFARKEAMSQ
jgi:hypothetical protein